LEYQTNLALYAAELDILRQINSFIQQGRIDNGIYDITNDFCFK